MYNKPLLWLQLCNAVQQVEHWVLSDAVHLKDFAIASIITLKLI